MALTLARDNGNPEELKITRHSENPVLVKEQRVLKTTEAAKILDLDKETTLQLMKNGSLPAFRLGREYRTSYLSCIEFIDACLASGTDIKTLL